jgi:hypothetical protein
VKLALNTARMGLNALDGPGIWMSLLSLRLLLAL